MAMDIEIKDTLLMQVYDEGILTDEQITEVLDEQERTGNLIKEILVYMGYIDKMEMLELIAGYMGANILDFDEIEIDPDIVKIVPVDVVRMYNIFPLEADEMNITLAVADLINPEVMDELRFVLTRDITFMVAREEDIKTAIYELYGDVSDSVTHILDELEQNMEDDNFMPIEGDNVDVVDIEHMANLTPVIRFVNVVLYQAVQDRASDIHFEPFEKEFKIRVRVDGALYELSPPPKHLALPVTSRIKVVSGLNIAERRLPQDGRIKLSIAGRDVDFRVSTLPTQYGESVVLRVLDQSAVQLDLEVLGFPDDVYETFSFDINKPNGIIVVTGPTGSGKTTTLYAGLRRLNKIETKILTAEDPVEYDVEGIMQVPVNEAVGLTFAASLRSFLRQDPDIIMVGEIRDVETAQIAIQASLTGHLVFSTLHTNDAPGAVTRLIDMGVEPFLIASTMEAILGQRLVRTICKKCRESYKPDGEILERLELTPNDVAGRDFYYGEGCPACNDTGYKGRRGIYEYLRISDPIRELIIDKRPTSVIMERAQELGMRSLRQDGIRCILDGYTTVEEVIKYS